MTWCRTVLVAVLTTACAGKAPEVADGQVCCESFGFGAEMKKCCETYAWTKPEDCTIPEGFTGGGKQVVDNGKCPAH